MQKSPLHSLLPFLSSQLPAVLPLLFCVVIAVIAVEPVASQTDLFTTTTTTPTTTPAPSYSEGIIDFGDLSPTPTYTTDFSGADASLFPTPSTDFGLENVGQGIQRTISPTIDTALLTGRGMPSRTPTYEPTLSPTERGFGTGVTIPIPGVDMNTLQPRPTAAITAAEVTRPTTNGSKSTSIRGCWSSQTILLFLLLLP
jgi:hypothetical protein